jgi:hypothetical protein
VVSQTSNAAAEYRSRSRRENPVFRPECAMADISNVRVGLLHPLYARRCMVLLYRYTKAAAIERQA